MESGAHGCADGSLDLYERLLGSSWLAERREVMGWRGGGGLFSAALTIWLSIRQRLLGGCSLERAWLACSYEEARHFSPKSARARKGELSMHASGLDYARHALPLALAEEAADRLYEEARLSLRRADGPSVFLLDGSSLTLERTAELALAYPSAPTQHGESHWPVVRMVVAHELATGVAVRPEYGPMYGPHATSEQALARRLAGRLPKDCLVIADRNFGVFQIAWALRERRLLLRLTDQRAGALGGSASGLDQPCVWRPSAQDKKAWPQGLPKDAAVHGRLVTLALRVPHQKASVRLCLFTTDLHSSPAELAKAYSLRWGVETDLRSLKQAVGLEVPRARSKDMLAKELVLAVAAYNLLRSLMAQAAQRAGLDPRRMSFARARACVEAFAARGQSIPEDIGSLLVSIAARPIPLRPDRHYPRHLWTKARHYPSRKQEVVR